MMRDLKWWCNIMMKDCRFKPIRVICNILFWSMNEKPEWDWLWQIGQWSEPWPWHWTWTWSGPTLIQFPCPTWGRQKRTEIQLALKFLFLPSITLCYPIIILCPDTLGINHRTLLSSEPWCYLLSGQRRPSVGQHAEMLGPTFYWSHWRWHYCDITRSHRAPGHCIVRTWGSI